MYVCMCENVSVCVGNKVCIRVYICVSKCTRIIK